MAADPLGGRDALEWSGVFAALQQHCRCSEAQLVEHRQGAKSQQRCRGAEVPWPPVGPDAHAGREPFDIPGDAQLFGKIHVCDVTGEKVVIEGLERFAADLEHSGETARARIAFENANLTANLGQSQRGGEARKPGADDRHITHRIGVVR